MHNLYRNISKCVITKYCRLRSVAGYGSMAINSVSSGSNLLKLPVDQRQCFRPVSCLHFQCYSTDANEPPHRSAQRKIPKMSDDDVQLGGSFLSFFTTNFNVLKIRRYDADFSLDDFLDGSNKAIEVCIHLYTAKCDILMHFLLILQIVSDKLAMGDFDGLRGMVTNSLIDDLSERMSTWTDEQRSALRTVQEDICKAIVNHIDIQENDDGIVVKVRVVYHIVKGYKALQDGRISAQDFMEKSSQLVNGVLFV